ncbi:cupin domain-containing protein [Bradyrhizobium sp. LjRoot220]|uniref:cupin domain-containing protein n=1 Tax=Bradyrhizobium sp. LjRoot220 TaxID=3342284 RepID=UPI003ED05911
MSHAHQQNAPKAHVVDWRGFERLDIMGPVIQFLSPPDGKGASPCILRGVVPPGVCIPLHSHDDPETFIQISGELEGLSESDGKFAWSRMRPGDVFHVQANAKHAFRNRASEPAVSIIVTTAKLAGFLRDIGIPTTEDAANPGAPSPERISQFLALAERLGYWNAGPDENARLGLVPAQPS